VLGDVLEIGRRASGGRSVHRAVDRMARRPERIAAAMRAAGLPFAYVT
jgi:hypothetical protein